MGRSPARLKPRRHKAPRVPRDGVQAAQARLLIGEMALQAQINQILLRIQHQDQTIKLQGLKIQELRQMILQQDQKNQQQDQRIQQQGLTIQRLDNESVQARRHTRAVARLQMNNVFVNILKFAREIEPSGNPGVAMTEDDKNFFKKVDTEVNLRNADVHPRIAADIEKDAVAFAKMLRDHQRAGDRLNKREQLYLRVFEKTGAIKAARIGNMM
jgi:hypothetical protein